MIAAVRPVSPRTVAELVSLICAVRGEISYLAGGTDLILALESGLVPELLVDVTGVSDLSGIGAGAGRFRIGAATSLTDIADHRGIRENAAALAQAAAQVGSVQIRNRATIGGNIASAVPAGDILPVLASFDSRINVLRRGGRIDALRFFDLVIGRGQTSLANGDLILSVDIPIRPGTISAFAKIGRRKALSIARLNLAVVAHYDPTLRVIDDICVAVGAIAPVPVRLHAMEQALAGRAPDQAFANEFVSRLQVAVDAAIPTRSSHPYKRRAVLGLGLDLLETLFNHEFDLPDLTDLTDLAAVPA